MKTLTELSGSVIRVAAAAVAEAMRSHPTGESPTPEASPQAAEVIEAAVSNATGLSGDRLAMLHGAVEAAGLRIHDVRLVRVFGEEEQVPGATKVGAYQYVVDRFPATMR